MNPTLARIISTIFHPIFLPLYGILVLLFCFPYQYNYVPDKMWNITIGCTLSMTMLMPALMILIMKKLAIVDDFDVTEQKQGILPYLLFFFFYLMTFLLIRPKEANSIIFMEDPILSTILLGATISLAIGFFLNNFWKVSIHTLGITNLFAFVCLVSSETQQSLLFLIIVLLILVGLVGSARIYLKAHTTKEVYIGVACGVFGQMIAFFYYLSRL